MFSIRRIIQEIKGEKHLNLIAIISIFVCQTILVISQVKINQPGVCIYDSFAMISHSLGYSIIPIAILFTMLYLREDFTVERTVRMKSFKIIWLSTVAKISVLSFLFTAISLVLGGVLGKIIAFETYSWNKNDSIFYVITGQILPDLSYIKFIIVFLLNIFLTVLIMDLIMIVFYWIFHSFIVGCFISVSLSFILCFSGSWFYAERGVHYSIWMNPFSYTVQFVYPVIICLLIITIGFFVKRKDISLISREGI